MFFRNSYLFINMGRKKKYTTDEELRIARNKRRMKYYNRNKEKERKEALERYYENERNLQNNQ